MPVRGMSNTLVTYNSQSLTAYANQADVQTTLNQIEVTNLASTAKEFISEPSEWTIRIAGMFDIASDTILGPDVVTPGTKRNAVISFIEGGQTLSYTWTANAEIGNYQITSTPTGMIGWSAELKLSGSPARAVV